MDGPSPPAPSNQPNTLLPQCITARPIKPLKRKRFFQRFRPSNFAEPKDKAHANRSGSRSSEVEIVKVVERGQKQQALKFAVTTPALPAGIPIDEAATRPAWSVNQSQIKPAVASAFEERLYRDQPVEIIDLTNDDDDAPTLHPMLPAPQKLFGSQNAPLPHINLPPPERSTNNNRRRQQSTWSRSRSGKIELPIPRQSHSAGYYHQWKGPKYKVLPAGFGGLELARGHFGRSARAQDGGESERKVRKDMEYTLRRHVEEYRR